VARTAPTGRVINISWVSIFRFEGDMIAERWVIGDDLAMLRQLGG
jgi:predicted ester cyclase